VSPDGRSGLDEARPVRPGEELDTGRLSAFLRERSLTDGTALEVQQFPGGYSNLTYLVRSGDREWVLRRPPAGAAVRGGHDMLREHRLLSRLAPVYAKAPRPVAACEDLSVLGAPFYLMERVRGVILRRHRPVETPIHAGALSASLVDTLSELHAVDVEAAGLSDLGRPQGYALRQVRGWTERWSASRTGYVPAIEGAARWLNEQPWPDARPALVHNDFKYDNVVLDPDDLARVVAVLDWEMATVGDPLLDLGTSLAYWVDADDAPAWREGALSDLTARPGSLTRMEVAERWARTLGRGLDGLVAAYVFGLFKVAVIAQQIYARFQRGLTQDPRFGRLGAVVEACGETAEAAIARRRIDRLAS
jgi:aminoglycoside phosphotransferase (APT) family kinase protein